MSLNPPLPLTAEPPVTSSQDFPEAPSRLAEGFGDLAAGLSRSWIWTSLAYQDIRVRYRGSILGPFWVTLTNLVLVAALGGIYGALFHMEIAVYVPFLLCGLPIWFFIQSTINEGCDAFFAARDVIPQVRLPFSIHAYRVVYRNLIVFAHNAITIPVGLLIFQVTPNWRAVEVPLALMLLCVNGVWLCLLLGTISARFRDVPQIIANAVQVLFFATPIFWPLSSAQAWEPYLVYNPFFAAIDIIRSPLLGHTPYPSSWPVLLACTVIIGAFSLAVFIRFRERIAYWV